MPPPGMEHSNFDANVAAFLDEPFVIERYGHLEGDDRKMAHNIVKVALIASQSRREWVESSFEALGKLKETLCRQ